MKVNFIFVSSHWNVSIYLRWWLDFLGHFYRSKKLMATKRDDWCVCHFKVLEKSRMESRWLMIKLYCLLLLYKEESYDPSKYMLERENKFDWKMRRENFTYSFFRFTTYWQCFLSFLFGIFFIIVLFFHHEIGLCFHVYVWLVFNKWWKHFTENKQTKSNIDLIWLLWF